MKNQFEEVENETLDQLKLENRHENVNIADIEIDHQLIKEAVDKGIAIRERRDLFTSNVVFLLAAFMIFIIAIVLIAQGYAFILLVLQILMIVITPVLIPLAIRRHLKGGTI